MKDVYFNSIDIVSFKAYREPTRIPLERMGLGLWFVKGANLISPRLGSNGSGKSSIFDCLCWVLFGRSVGGHRTPDMKGWGGKDAPEASVTLDISGTYDSRDLDRYVIRRKGVSNGLWLDDKVCTQETIDRLLGLNFANFLHTIVLGQGKDLFFDLSAPAKMDVLSETLDLTKWDVRIARARKAVSTLEIAKAAKNSTYQSCLRTIEKAENTIADLKQKARAWESDRANADEIKRKQIEALEKSLKVFQTDLDDADLDYDAAETELRHSQTTLDQVQADSREGITRLTEINVKLNHKLTIEDDFKLRLRRLLDGDTCPSCGQELDKKAIKAHRATLNAELDALEVEIDKLRDQADDAKKADGDARRSEEAHAADVKKYRTRSNDAIDKRTRAQGNVARLKAEIDAAKRTRTETEEKTNPFDALVSDARQDLNDSKAEKVKLGKKLDQLEYDIEDNRYWIEGFKQVRLYLIDEVLAELEGVTQTLLSSVGLDEWRVRYDIDKENKSGTVKPGLNVSIYQPEYEQAVKWELFSGGEGQRLRLIGAVALSEVLLRRAGVRCDLLVLDEPTRHLSPEGVRDTVDFLIERAAQQQVIYIDHQAIDTNRMAGVLKVTRDRDGASVKLS